MIQTFKKCQRAEASGYLCFYNNNNNMDSVVTSTNISRNWTLRKGDWMT